MTDSRGHAASCIGSPGFIGTTVLAGLMFVQALPCDAQGEEEPGAFRTLDLENRPAIVEPDRSDPRVAPWPPERVVSESSDCSSFYRQIRTTSGNALVEAVLAAEFHCIDDLEWIGDQPEVQHAASSERHVVDVARAVPVTMSRYAAEARAKDDVFRLFLYLDKARDIRLWCRERRRCEGQVWHSAETYSLDAGSPAGDALRGAFDAYVEHPTFMSRNDDHHAEILGRVVSILGRFPLQEDHLGVVTRWLKAWDEEYASSPSYQFAMLGVLNIAYSCHRRPSACGLPYAGDAELFDGLRDFVMDPEWLGSSSQRILELSTIELGRFSLYAGSANYDRLPAAVRSVRGRHRGTSRGNGIWLRLVGSIDYNDGTNCARYGLCDWYAGAGFNARFRRELFTGRRTCLRNACAGDTISLHAQGLGERELDVACRRLNEHSRTFESMFDTQCRPVQGDVNSHLDLFIFSDGASCEDFESAVFGRDPDSCSGIFWEGDASSPGSVAVTTEKEAGDPYIDPELAIWNFEHEYAHYLDARYNKHGPFTGDPAIQGWSEGIAEYFANSVTEYHHGKGRCSSTHSLTDTLLLSGSIPTSYNQRHIVIRFLMENWRPFVDGMLRLMRQGRYDEFKAYVAREGPKAEPAWEAWVDSGCVRKSVPPPPAEPEGPCERSERTLCLLEERFEVKVDWWTAAGEPSHAYAVEAGTEDSGLFWFVDGQNWEILIKVLDGCESNGHVWVYGAATTDLGYSIRVRNTVTGTVKKYGNEPGSPSRAIADSRAFSDGCQRARR
ncbi:MAG: collagenase [Acidobacteria bacterium]|nr:collagenase [Acidobacteriota bacterium]